MNSKTPSKTRTLNSSLSATQACAACKYERRKCTPDCPLAPYFPPDCQRQYLNCHRLFGKSNMLKISEGLDPHSRFEAMETMKIQADMRAHDPVGGCHRVIVELERQYERDYQELAVVLHQLELCRQAAAAAQVSVQDQDQINAVNGDDAVYGNHMMVAQQQQEQQYLDYLNFGGNDNAGISSNSVNNNNIDVNGNAATNGMDMTEVPQSMFNVNAQQQEDDVKPLIDMFDETHALAIGDEKEVGEMASKVVDLDLAAGSYYCSTEIQAKREETNPMEQVREHDLKGAASLFTLTSQNRSYV